MRVKSGPARSRKHKKVLARTKGMRMTRGRLFRVSHEADLHAGKYALAGRRLRKRDFRKLWIQRINAGLSQLESAPKYSKFINLLKLEKIDLNRKMLSELATNYPKAFQSIVDSVSKSK